jgi:hypothetical protein
MPVEFSRFWIPSEGVLEGYVIPVAQDLIELLNHLFILANDRNLQHSCAPSQT